MNSLEVHSLALGPLPTNAFLVCNMQTLEAIAIDVPPDSAESLLKAAHKHHCTLTAVLITHSHWDHYADAARLKSLTKAPVYSHAADREWLEHPDVMRSFLPWGITVHPLAVDHWLQAGDTLTLLGHTCHIRHVPGHAQSNILLYFPNIQAAFVGDAIFKESIGRYDLPGGDKATLLASIQSQIYTLPVETRLYSGHGPVTTVAHEQQFNPYIRA